MINDHIAKYQRPTRKIKVKRAFQTLVIFFFNLPLATVENLTRLLLARAGTVVRELAPFSVQYLNSSQSPGQ